MTEQMRAVTLEDDLQGYYIDGRPYDFEAGKTVVFPRRDASNIVKRGDGFYEGDVFNVDDDEFRGAIGVQDGVVDPEDMTVEEVKERVEEMDEESLLELRQKEIDGDGRKTAVEAIEEELDER